MRAGQPRPDVAVGRAGIDERRRPDRPGVGQPGAERIGPVERAGMQHPVVGRQPVPALPHHPPRPGGALGVHHALRAGRRCRRYRPCRPGRRARSRRRAPGRWPRSAAISRRPITGTPGGSGSASPAPRQTSAGARSARIGASSAAVSCAEDGDRHGPQRVGGEEEDGEVGAVAEAQQHPVAAADPARREPAGRAPHRLGQRAVGPALRHRARRGEHLERDLVRRARGGREGMRGHVERRGAGREGAVVEERRARAWRHC